VSKYSSTDLTGGGDWDRTW